MSSDKESKNAEKGLPKFFGTLINGDLGLAKTYWLTYLLVNFIANILIGALRSPVTAFSTLIVVLTWNVIVLIGLWRAANKYSGLKLWPILAKIVVVFGWLYMGEAFFSILLAIIKNSHE